MAPAASAARRLNASGTLARTSFVSRSSRTSASRSKTSDDEALGTDVRRGGGADGAACYASQADAASAKKRAHK